MIAWAATLSMMMLGLLWLVCARSSTSKPEACEQAALTNNVGIKTRENATPTADIDVKTCEFDWTERGERLHSKRDCVHLRRAKAVSTGTLCKVCLKRPSIIMLSVAAQAITL